MKRYNFALLVVASFAGLTGCATTVLIDPRVPLSGPPDTVIVEDSRSVTLPNGHAGQLEPKRYIGQTEKMVIALRTGSVAELVGSAVAAQLPNSKVSVSEFTLTVNYGVWLATATAKITATIVVADKAAVVVRASGLNNYCSPTPENFELAVDNALADFSEKLKAMR